MDKKKDEAPVREEAPAEAGEIGAEYDDAAHCVTLAACPPGLFLWNGTLGFKSEYGAMEPVGISPHHQQWKVGNRVDAYCADSGEYFWGGTSNHDDRAKLLVYPISAETVAMVASHGLSALRAQPPARDLAAEIDDVKKTLEADGQAIEYFEAQRRVAAFKALRGTEADKRAVSYIDAAILALQAREDAQPVGWISEHVLRRMTCDDHEMVYGSKNGANHRGDAVALYTHPVPDALRVAVEALEFYRDGFSYKIGKKSQRIEWFATGQLLDDCGNKALDALAALQQDQTK